MQFNIGDLILWKITEELSTITGYWLDYNKVPYYEIQFYSTQFKKYYTEYVGEERIKVLIEYGSIIHYPVSKEQ